MKRLVLIAALLAFSLSAYAEPSKKFHVMTCAEGNDLMATYKAQLEDICKVDPCLTTDGKLKDFSSFYHDRTGLPWGDYLESQLPRDMSLRHFFDHVAAYQDCLAQQVRK